MDGASGGGGESCGGGWAGGGGYDATNQIKQLLRIPTEDTGRSTEEKSKSSVQNSSSQKQEKQVQSSYAFEKAANTSSKQQTWEANRFQDSRRRVDSPGGGNPRQGNFDPSRGSPFRNYDNRHVDNYSSPSRNAHKQANYDCGYGSNLHHPHLYQSHHHHHHHHHHQASGATLRDNKDPRMNGPRHVSSPHNPLIAVGTETETPEFRPSPEVLAELEEQFLYPLKKKSLRFPKAKYFCRLCDYHCDSLVVCKRHITDTRHRRLKEAKDLETTLKNLPPTVDAHVAAIDKLIISVSEQMKATPEMINTRRELVSQLNDLLVAKVKGCKLEMVGSSVCGFCLKTSDVNIDIVMEGNQSPSTALLGVKELVAGSDTYINVVDDLSSSFPTMSFTHSKTNQRMVVGASSASSKYTNQLLGEYSSIDHRVPILGVAFRYWAKICQIDDQSRGTLPPHAFPLMLIHFLQQHHPPVLPVLHTLHPNPDGDVYLRAADIGDKWKTNNTESVGKLWLELFKFYTIGFKMTDLVINVRSLQPIIKTDKGWSKKIAIEDPFVQKRNLTRTISGNPVFEYILDCFKISYRHLAIPQLSYGPLFLHIIFKEVNLGSKAAGESVCQRNKKGEMLLESIEKAGQSQSEASSECEMERTEEEVDVAVEEEAEEDDDTTNMSGFEADLSTMSPEDTLEEANDSASPNGLSSQEEEASESIPEELTATLHFVTPSQAAKLMQQVRAEDLIFRFEEKFFTLGQKPPLICGSCQKEGHCKADCREDELPPLKRLPPLNSHFLNILTAIFEQLTMDFEPTAQEIEERDKIVADLENYICQFFRGVTLKLFGSSANGFGFQRSDLDICMTFEGNPMGQNIDHIKIIESLAEKLKRYRQCGHVFAITTAKVPIVKFSIRRAYLEGDLSLYNTLALQNTKLLYTYARIDHRVKCLGYAMKYFAKLCDIGDASRGSLSSYAYILMVLHFLQQCKPPVIPVLQELYDHSKPPPQLIIDGWNAWFYDNLDGLPKVWKDYGKNTDSVGQLWVSMLRYYTESFNWKHCVVTIRQLAPLSRLLKLWNSRCIAIEDPFDLSHNLGAGLSRKMNTFIMKAFIRGREVFGTAVMGCPPGYRHLVDYLFDSKQLTDGAPPNDRGCRFCGKIGHIQKDCPKRKVSTEKREKKERQKDRRDISRLTNIEDGREESSKHAENESHETKEATHQEVKKLGQKTMAGTPRGGAASSKSSEDVATGNSPTQASTTPMDQSLAAISRVKKQDQGKSSHKPSAPLPVTEATNSGVNNLMQDGGSANSQCVKSVNIKCGNNILKTNMPASESGSRIRNLSESSPGALRVASGDLVKPVENNKAVSSSPSSVPRMQTHTTIGPSCVLLRGQTESVIGGVGSGPVSVPPGFQNLPHVSMRHSVQEQALSQGMKIGTQGQSKPNYTAKPHSPSNLANTNQMVSQSLQPQEQKQAQQFKQIQEQQQQQLHSQQQQLAQPQRQWGFWQNAGLPQVHVNSKAQKQDEDKSKNYQITTSASNQSNQPHQQQYPYSISPAALFHMASQAASGQISAMLLPNATENTTTSSRSGLPAPTTTAVGTIGNGAPPPGFSAPVPISYHGQQVDALPMNKLMIGSPVFRSSVSQADGQTASPNTVSQPFLSVSGPVPGIYVSAHTPHTYGDPALNQQHPVFDTRHFISQQMTQGLHQNVAQGLPQGVAATVPPGMQAGAGVSLPPPGLAASVPQGMSNSVPQAIPQGMHQNLQSGVSPVSLGSALSQGMQAVPMGHPFPPQHTYPQQGYQMTMAGTGGYYSEYVIGDPTLQSHSPSGQGPPNIPAELMPEMTFQRPEIYDHPLQALPQYMSSSLPQHQSLITPMSQSHPSVALPPPPHPSLPTSAPTAAYTQGSLIYIDGERDGNPIMQ